MSYRIAVLFTVFLLMQSGSGSACNDLLSTKIPFEIKKSEIRETSREGVEPNTKMTKGVMHVYRQDDGTTKIIEKLEYEESYKVITEKFGFIVHTDIYRGGKLVQTSDSTALSVIEMDPTEKQQEFSITTNWRMLTDYERSGSGTTDYKITYEGEQPLIIGPCMIKTKVYDIYMSVNQKKMNRTKETRRYYSEELGIVLKSTSKGNLSGAIAQTDKTEFKLQNIEISFPSFPFE